ncbi:unnamed protein product [Spirodela intermedia]|uniref:Uncharacterized protein n=2 Tax=Spirodela intermedia TaxID=51605 RepID=A0A7I8IYN1_SPIIN|nr:unnamed protein product [Spirodela intermedia]CAA6662978.1 unnamed protein product [Spirodela intermedia]CAA7399403.1 unnamed protein product [Spirodela intermedia]
MVAASPGTQATSATAAVRARNPKKPSVRHEDLPNPTRSPLLPSEKDNAGSYRRPRTKEVTSRYLSSYSSSFSSTTSTSASSAGATATSATSSLSSSSTALSSRRFPSPLLTSRPSPTASTVLQPSTAKRSQSVDRTRAAAPRLDPSRSNNCVTTEISSASRPLRTTRSLSVSFQGESFVFQTSRVKNDTAGSTRKPTPDRRRYPATPMRNGMTGGGEGGGIGPQTENSRSGDYNRWPAAHSSNSNPLTKSLEYSLNKGGSIFATENFMRHSIAFDEARHASYDAGDLSASSDTDSVSSGSNSGAHNSSAPACTPFIPHGISVPARFWQDTNSRTILLSDSGLPQLTPLSRATAAPRFMPVKKPLIDGPVISPRTVSSPINGPTRHSSPVKAVSSPSRMMASPSRMRSNDVLMGQPGNAPSIINFAAEVLRRGKRGESRIEEAHLLRLLHNRHLQWRYVNARATSSLSVQIVAAEKSLHSAWITATEMRDSVIIKKITLHLLRRNMKLGSLLKEQMTYLEEWSLMDREHGNSLSGGIEALEASILRLPVVSGARANIQDIKDAVGSAVDVMQAIGSSVYSVLLKAEQTRSLVSELLKLAAQEGAMLEESRSLLCNMAAIHVKQCSLRAHLQQLRRYPG